MTDITVAHIHQFFVPDQGYQENHLPAKQADLGLDVHIVTSDQVPPKFADQYEFEPGTFVHKGVKVHRLSSLYYSRRLSEVLISGLSNKLNRISPDIVQSRNFLSTQSYRAARYCGKKGVPLFVDDHIDNGNISIDRTDTRILIKAFKKICSREIVDTTELFLPVQPYSREFLKTEFGISYDHMELLPLGVDTDTVFPNSESGEKVRSQLGINRGKLIIFAGNIDPRKDIEVLIKSFGEVVSNFEAHLLILGSESDSSSGQYLSKLKSLVKRIGLNDNVIFHDAVEHSKLPDFLNAADFGVWPGKLGITTLEAVGTGLPVIVCDSKATNYIIGNNNGLQFERENVSELSTQIKTYLKNGELARKHGKNAIEHVNETLSWRAIAEKNIELYYDALRPFDNLSSVSNQND